MIIEPGGKQSVWILKHILVFNQQSLNNRMMNVLLSLNDLLYNSKSLYIIPLCQLHLVMLLASLAVVVLVI
jgi:hypothetical protein